MLHGIDVRKGKHAFATRDVDFFLGPHYLVTVHDGESAQHRAPARAVRPARPRCWPRARSALLHRIVDTMVDNYRPVMDALERRIDELEEQAFSGQSQLARQMLQARQRAGRRCGGC